MRYDKENWGRSPFPRQLLLTSNLSWKWLTVPIFLFLAFPSPILAEDLNLSGHLKHQLTASQYQNQTPQDLVGQRQFLKNDTDLRLNTTYSSGSWFSELNAEALGVGGKQLNTSRKIEALGFGEQTALINDDKRLFDLTIESIDEKYYSSVLRLDRLNFGYKGESSSVIFGRQAITWGGGLTFHLFDLFNPFSPIAIDKEYKTGDDMIYAQSQVGLNSELQLLYIPRRNEERSLRATESSGAALWRTTLSSWEFSALGARHYDETYLGTGFNRSILEAVVRTDLIFETVEGSSDEISLVTNIDRSWTVAGTNIYGFIEYFYNGTGGDTELVEEISATTQAKLNRGERFTLGTDYISWGGRVELRALTELYLLQIANLHDESGAIQLRLVDDTLAEDLRLQVGTNIPYGKRGSEFGGVKLPGEVFLTPAEQFFVRISYYL